MQPVCSLFSFPSHVGDVCVTHLLLLAPFHLDFGILFAPCSGSSSDLPSGGFLVTASESWSDRSGSGDLQDWRSHATVRLDDVRVTDETQRIGGDGDGASATPHAADDARVAGGSSGGGVDLGGRGGAPRTRAPPAIETADIDWAGWREAYGIAAEDGV